MKKVLLGALVVVVIVAFIVDDIKTTNKAIEQCVAGGQTREICESGLLK